MAKGKRKQDPVLEVLKAVPLFQALAGEEEKLSLLAEVMAARTVKAGNMVAVEGEMGNELFVLQQGEVEVTKKTVDGEPYTVAILGEEAHPSFGELALVDADERSATIRASKDCRMLALKREDFLRLGDHHPEIGLSIMRELAKIVARRFRDTNRDVVLLFEALAKEVSRKEID